MKGIRRFEGEYRFLSNFYLCMVPYGLVYPSVENAFQAQKTKDKEEREEFLAISPARAKQLGRQLDIRPDWEAVKENLMIDLLMIKFHNVDLKQKLLATGDAELVEGNWWGDEVWGVCNGRGQNLLGKCLMAVRTAYAEREAKQGEE